MTMALLVVARAMLPVVRKPLTGVAPAVAAPYVLSIVMTPGIVGREPALSTAPLANML